MSEAAKSPLRLSVARKHAILLAPLITEKATRFPSTIR